MRAPPNSCTHTPGDAGEAGALDLVPDHAGLHHAFGEREVGRRLHRRGDRQDRIVAVIDALDVHQRLRARRRGVVAGELAERAFLGGVAPRSSRLRARSRHAPASAGRGFRSAPPRRARRGGRRHSRIPTGRSAARCRRRGTAADRARMRSAPGRACRPRSTSRGSAGPACRARCRSRRGSCRAPCSDRWRQLIQPPSGSRMITRSSVPM